MNQVKIAFDFKEGSICTRENLEQKEMLIISLNYLKKKKSNNRILEILLW